MVPGAFVWYELATTETEAASRFYGEVLGWAAEPVAGMPYTLFKAGETLPGSPLELLAGGNARDTLLGQGGSADLLALRIG